MDGSGSILGSARFFPSPQLPDRFWNPPILLFKGYRVLSGLKRQRCEAYHSFPSSVEVKKRVAIHHSLIYLHGIVLN
jgi:hypothetical protein